MKHKIFSLLFIFLSVTCLGQSSVAKLKYEEAEDAYSKNDFITTVSKLDEAESILGSSNPRILYLRILADAKIVESDPYLSFSRLSKLRKNCAEYMRQTDNNPALEEKFKDIYKIFETLKAFPISEEAFNAKKRESDNVRQFENQKKSAFNALIHFAEQASERYKYKPNISRSDFLNYNPAVYNMSFRTSNETSFWGYPVTHHVKKTGLSIKQIFEPGPAGYRTDDNDRIISFTHTVSAGSEMDEKIEAEYQEITKPFRDLPSTYQNEKIEEKYGSYFSKFILSIPSKTKADQIDYYITITKQKFKKHSSLSLLFSTKRNMAFN